MAGRHPSGEHRAWTSFVATGFGVLALLVSVLFLGAVPGALDDRRAYLTAPVCPGGSRPHDDCVAVVPATVRGLSDEPRGRGVRHWLGVSERGTGEVRRLRMSGAGPVFGVVRPGDEVRLTYWRGEVRTVGFGSVDQATQASPANGWRLPLGVGLALLPVGALLLWTARFVRRGPEGAASRPWWPACVWGAGLTLSGAALPAARVGPDVAGVLLVTAAAVPVSAAVGGLCGAWMRGRLRRAEDTSGIVPRRPRAKACVRTGVHGEVPYSVPGFGHLVVGDGRPAATGDPVGRFARRPLPRTLVPERVRAFGPADPAGWQRLYRYDGVVLECRDGPRPVLVVTSRRDAPLVLGALTASDVTTAS